MWKWGFQVCRQQLRPHSISKIQNTRLFTEYRPKHASVEHVELILGSKAVQNRDPRNPNEQKCSKLQLSKWRVYIAGPLNRLRKELCRHVGKQMAADLSEGWAPVKESLPCRHTWRGKELWCKQCFETLCTWQLVASSTMYHFITPLKWAARAAAYFNQVWLISQLGLELLATSQLEWRRCMKLLKFNGSDDSWHEPKMYPVYPEAMNVMKTQNGIKIEGCWLASWFPHI